MLKKFMIFLFHSNMVLLFSREGGSCTDYCPKHKGCNVTLVMIHYIPSAEGSNLHEPLDLEDSNIITFNIC